MAVRNVDPVTAQAVRLAARRLAGEHPGQAVEVRVPPYAAVQVGVPGSGSVHRRGTPPSVVEMDAETFLDLVEHRLGWRQALSEHRVSASGAHADLAFLFEPDAD